MQCREAYLGCLSFLGAIGVPLLHQRALAHPSPYFVTLCYVTVRLEDMDKLCFSFYCIYLFACLCTSVHTCVPSTQVQLRGQHLEVVLLLPNGFLESNIRSTPQASSTFSSSITLCWSQWPPLLEHFLPVGGRSTFRYWEGLRG